MLNCAIWRGCRIDNSTPIIKARDHAVFRLFADILAMGLARQQEAPSMLESGRPGADIVVDSEWPALKDARTLFGTVHDQIEDGKDGRLPI